MEPGDVSEDRYNQISVIRTGKWRSAWFTTFTFNAVFFEAYVLPALHECGCDEVTVLVDEVFYIESLAEAPRHAGTAYRILPVALSGGVFHAKLTYLEGRDSADILMVGSGNMTWPGFGHQLECLDVLSSWRDARAFDDLADALVTFLARPDVHAGEAASALKSLALRAQTASGPYLAGSSRVRLLASATESIARQVIRLLGNRGFQDLVALSPFHAPDAGPVLRLASELRIPRLGIAIDAGTGATPVAAHAKGVRFLQRKGEDQRSTHAKWYEFRGKECWLLSGSVNATKTSMETAANFEVATLRPVGRGDLPTWEGATPNQYAANVLEIAAKDHSVSAISASLQGHRLWGSFLKSGADGIWRASLLQDGAIHRLGSAQVAAGHFEIQLAELPIQLEPCQLMMRKGARTASAWIMFEAELRMTSADREFARRVRKLSGSDASPEDYHAVLAWLADKLHALRVDVLSHHRPKALQREEGDAAPKGPFEYERWHFDEAIRASTTLVIAPCRAALSALSTYARAVITGRAPGPSEDTSEFDASGKSHDSSATTAKQAQAEARQMESMQKALRRHLEHPTLLLPDVGTFLLEALLWVITSADRKHRTVVMDCVPFLQWTAVAARYQAAYPKYEPLAILTVSVCTCGFSMISENDSRKERLCTLAHRTSIDPTSARAMVTRALADKPCFHSLTAEEIERAEAAVDPLLNYRGFGAQLAAYLAEWQAHGGLLAPTTNLVQQTLGAASALSRIRASSKEVRHWSADLPEECGETCYYRFPSSDRSVLRNVRALRCIHCGTLHFWTGSQ